MKLLDLLNVIEVALLAEGVDRNHSSFQLWRVSRVALLAEGVDRNVEYALPKAEAFASPSSRRAWIEILILSAASCSHCVALLAEGVDRNIFRR